MTKDEALKLALEALKEDRAWLETDAPTEVWEKNNEAIITVEAALEAKDESVAWKWHQAPVKTSWGDEMVVADLAIDKDHTVSVYCEHDQTAKVEAMFNPLQQEENNEPIQKQIIKLKTVDEPCNQVMSLGQMMRDWLQSQIADSNTSVDVGKGFSEFDLWVQCEGKELFITIKEKK